MSIERIKPNFAVDGLKSSGDLPGENANGDEVSKESKDPYQVEKDARHNKVKDGVKFCSGDVFLGGVERFLHDTVLHGGVVVHGVVILHHQLVIPQGDWEILYPASVLGDAKAVI